MVFYTDKFIPQRFAGYTIGPLIFIRPNYKTDLGLLEHERTHVRQFWESYGTMGFLYLLSSKHRLLYEVAAFRAQLKISPGNEKLFATLLSSNYKLNIDVTQAEQLLTKAQL